MPWSVITSSSISSTDEAQSTIQKFTFPVGRGSEDVNLATTDFNFSTTPIPIDGTAGSRSRPRAATLCRMSEPVRCTVMCSDGPSEAVKEDHS